jgi:hypothetical protein
MSKIKTNTDLSEIAHYTKSNRKGESANHSMKRVDSIKNIIGNYVRFIYFISTLEEFLMINLRYLLIIRQVVV